MNAGGYDPLAGLQPVADLDLATSQLADSHLAAAADRLAGPVVGPDELPAVASRIGEYCSGGDFDQRCLGASASGLPARGVASTETLIPGSTLISVGAGMESTNSKVWVSGSAAVENSLMLRGKALSG